MVLAVVLAVVLGVVLGVVLVVVLGVDLAVVLAVVLAMQRARNDPERTRTTRKQTKELHVPETLLRLLVSVLQLQVQEETSP